MTNLERLRAIITAVEERIQAVSTPAINDEGRVLLEVSGSLLRGCLESARAVEVLVAAEEYGGLFSVERTAWEMWRELEYLLTAENTGKAAVKARANAAIEILGETASVEPPPGMRDRLEGILAELREKFPSAVEEVEKQRKNRRYHWSGQSRGAVVATKDTPHETVYRMLSWEAHPGLCFIREIGTREHEGRTLLDLLDSKDFTGFERSALAAGEYLQRAWNLFAQAWGVAKINFPMPEAP